MAAVSPAIARASSGISSACSASVCARAALKNTYGTNNDGIGRFLNVDVTGGDGPEWEIAQLDANTLLVAGSETSANAIGFALRLQCLQSGVLRLRSGDNQLAATMMTDPVCGAKIVQLMASADAAAFRNAASSNAGSSRTTPRSITSTPMRVSRPNTV